MNEITEILTHVKTNKHAAFFYTPHKVGNEKSYIYLEPKKSIICDSIDSIDDSLQAVDYFSKKYKFGYGFINYEVGYYFEERLKQFLNKRDRNLLVFHFFDEQSVEVIPTKNIKFDKLETLIKERSFNVENIELNQSKQEYVKSIKEIKRLIAEGDTYQVNYTLKSKFNFSGDVASFVASLIFNQSAEYTAFINDTEDYVISISPELFFKTDGKIITSKPMKGTIKRGINLSDDNSKKEELRLSKKDRAENIMIVDLLRNDIGKISQFNSVAVPKTFEIEKYESLYQMTSTVIGELKAKSFSSIIKNLFPCGSITGAPKIRTMRIIHNLEKEERGIYTGTIGIIDSGDYNFNIPIRTITLNKATLKGEMGIGSGIVWDSNADDEFEEAKLKSNFLTKSAKYFELLETILFERGEIFLQEYHISRLRNAAEYFLFLFNEEKITNLLNDIKSELDKNKKFKIRLLLTKWGEIKFSVEQINTLIPSGKILISNKMINSQNRFNYFKTTNRELFDAEFAKWKSKGFDDVIFLNENGEITEGAITNIMILKNDIWLTPPITAGLLDGCYRKHLMDSDLTIKESRIIIDDILNADEVIIFNSVRKEIKINEVILESDY